MNGPSIRAADVLPPTHPNGFPSSPARTSPPFNPGLLLGYISERAEYTFWDKSPSRVKLGPDAVPLLSGGSLFRPHWHEDFYREVCRAERRRSPGFPIALGTGAPPRWGYESSRSKWMNQSSTRCRRGLVRPLLRCERRVHRFGFPWAGVGKPHQAAGQKDSAKSPAERGVTEPHVLQS